MLGYFNKRRGHHTLYDARKGVVYELENIKMAVASHNNVLDGMTTCPIFDLYNCGNGMYATAAGSRNQLRLLQTSCSR